MSTNVLTAREYMKIYCGICSDEKNVLADLANKLAYANMIYCHAIPIDGHGAYAKYGRYKLLKRSVIGLRHYRNQF